MTNLDQIKKNQSQNCFCIDGNSPKLNFTEGNRNVDRRHCNKIYNSIKNGSKVPPILVDEKTLSIIDGQHRYEAYRILWKDDMSAKLDIVVLNFENPLLSAIEYNSKSKNWTILDYVNAYISTGNINYNKLKTFHDSNEYKKLFFNNNPSISISVYLLSNCNGNTNLIKNGRFITSDELISNSTRILKEIKDIYDNMNAFSMFDLNSDSIMGYALFRKTLFGEIGPDSNQYLDIKKNISNKYIHPEKQTGYLIYAKEFLRCSGYNYEIKKKKLEKINSYK